MYNRKKNCIRSYAEISKIRFIPPNILQHNIDSKADQPKHILYHQIQKTNQNKNTIIVRANNNRRTVHNNISGTNKHNIHNICKNTKNNNTHLRNLLNKRQTKIKQPQDNNQRTNQYLVAKYNSRTKFNPNNNKTSDDLLN